MVRSSVIDSPSSTLPTTVEGSHRVPRYVWFTFYAVSTIVLFWHLGQRGLTGSEERWAEIARWMVVSGDYFHPQINGHDYFDKPLLSYWLIVLVSWFTGRIDEFGLRFFSALSGVITLLCTVQLGRKLWSERIGLAAGWILLTTYGMLYWSRIGEADMENLAAIMAAVVWFVHRKERKTFVTYFIYWLICFFGAQTKGLTAIVVPLLPIAAWLWMNHRWKAHLNLAHIAGFIVASMSYLVPFVIARFTQPESYHESGLYMVFRENIVRYFVPFDHVEPVYIYFLHLPRLFLPWSFLLIYALLNIKKMYGQGSPQTRWLIVSMLAIFAFFTASGSRRLYYILPVLPFCALYTALVWSEALMPGIRRIAMNLQIGLLLFLQLIFVCSPLWRGLVARKVGFEIPFDILSFMVICGAVGLLLPILLKKWSPSVLSCFDLKAGFYKLVLFSLSISFAFVWLHTRFDDYRTPKRFALQARQAAIDAAIDPAHIVVYGNINVAFVFYMAQPRPLKVLRTPHELASYIIHGKGDKMLISRNEFLDQVLPQLPPEIRQKPVAVERINPWEKGHLSRKLTAWIIPRKLVKRSKKSPMVGKVNALKNMVMQ